MYKKIDPIGAKTDFRASFPLLEHVSHHELAMLMRTYCVQLLSGAVSVIKLRDAIHTRRTQETQAYLDQLRDAWTKEKNDS